MRYALLAGVVSVAVPTEAAETRFAASVLGDVTLAPEMTGHGALLLSVDVAELGAGMSFAAVLNTDTLRLSLDQIRVAEGLWLGLDAAGEAGFAALLPDYFQDGFRVAERGFWASYVGGGAQLTWSPHRRHWIRARVGVRRWIFAPNSDTSDAFVLPPDQTVFEPSLEYTYWSIRSGGEFRERERIFPRVNGIAMGGQLGLWLRSDDQEWGARDPADFDPADSRNDPDSLGIRPRAWIRAGTWLLPTLRWQVLQVAAYGVGEDDLSRDRIGGMNPYVTPIPGAPWGAFASERYAGGEWSWHVPVGGESELGVMLAGTYVADGGRTGDSSGAMMFGAGILSDLRFGAWQIDTRLGWTPTLYARDGNEGESLQGFAALLGVGLGGPE